jgi:hypothetical protein
MEKVIRDREAEEKRVMEARKQKKKDEKRARVEEEQAEMKQFEDDDIATMMGFGGFGSSKPKN